MKRKIMLEIMAGVFVGVILVSVTLLGHWLIVSKGIPPMVVLVILSMPLAHMIGAKIGSMFEDVLKGMD